MRWTVRGIDTYTANAVRDVADATGSTLGRVLALCVEIGLAEAKRQLEAEVEEGSNSNDLDQEARVALADLRQLILNWQSGFTGGPGRSG